MSSLDELAAAATAISEKAAKAAAAPEKPVKAKRPVSAAKLAEKELIARIKKGPPKSQEEALEVLALMMGAGRVKAPSVVSTTPSHLNDGKIPSF